MIDMTATDIIVEMPGGGKPILNQVSIEVTGETIHGIVGMSGAGKTTVLRCLAGTLPPSSGLVSHAGINIYDPGTAAFGKGRVAENVALLPQNPPATFNPRVRVRDSIIEPLLIAGIPRDEALSHIEETAFVVGLHPALLDRYPSGLSGGEARRAALARAMITEPKALLLDEPQSGIDLPSQLELLDLIVQLSKSEKVTVVIVGHDLNSLRSACTNLTVLDDGKVVESGPAERVIATPESKAARELVEAAGI